MGKKIKTFFDGVERVMEEIKEQNEKLCYHSGCIITLKLRHQTHGKHVHLP